MKILITGAAGFIGTNLIPILLEKNHEIIGIDNFYTGTSENIKKYSNKINFIEHDIINTIDIECDFIINLACPASPIHYQKDPIYTIKVCFNGTLNMLELSKKLKIPMVQASTSEIYGDPNISPQEESYWGNVNPIGIRSCYDEGKRAAETLCFDFRRQFNSDVRVIRIFNTYGPYMDINDGRVVSNFIIKALRGEDMNVFGLGDQTRSFCYVSDLVKGISNLTEDIDYDGHPINLGNDNEMTIKELALRVIELTKSKSKISYEELPEDDPMQRKPNITRASNILNWSPEVGLDEGLIKTIEYFKNKIV